MDRANSHTKSYNIPRSFEAMYINIKYELRAWVTCAYSSLSTLLKDLFGLEISSRPKSSGKSLPILHRISVYIC